MLTSAESVMRFSVSSASAYPFTLRFFDASNIHVYWESTAGASIELQRGVDFSVESKDDYTLGANIIMLRQLTFGTKIAIKRVLPPIQELALPNAGKLPSESLETQLDKFTMMLQQLEESVGRKLDGTDINGASATDQAAYWAALQSSVLLADAARVIAVDAAAEAAAAAGKTGKRPFELFYSLSAEAPAGAYALNGQTLDCSDSRFDRFWELFTTNSANGKIRVITEAAYAAEISTYGQCGAFVLLSSAERTIKLPVVNRYLRATTGTDGGSAGADKTRNTIASGGLVVMSGGGSSVISGSFTVPAAMALSNRANNKDYTSAGGDISVASALVMKGMDSDVSGSSWAYTYSINKTVTGGATSGAVSVDSSHIGTEVEPRNIKAYLYMQVYTPNDDDSVSAGGLRSIVFVASNFAVHTSGASGITGGTFSAPYLGIAPTITQMLYDGGVLYAPTLETEWVGSRCVCSVSDLPVGMSGTFQLLYLGGSSAVVVPPGAVVSSGGESSGGETSATPIPGSGYAINSRYAANFNEFFGSLNWPGVLVAAVPHDDATRVPFPLYYKDASVGYIDSGGGGATAQNAAYIGDADQGPASYYWPWAGTPSAIAGKTLQWVAWENPGTHAVVIGLYLNENAAYIMAGEDENRVPLVEL